MLLADSTWFIYAVTTHQWALAIQSVILAKFALDGIQKWKKERIWL